MVCAMVSMGSEFLDKDEEEPIEALYMVGEAEHQKRIGVLTPSASQA